MSVNANKLELSSLNYLWSCGSETDWKRALWHYYTLLGPEAKELNEYIVNIKVKEIETLSAPDFYNFLYNHYFVWKYTQKNRLATTRKHLKTYLTDNKLSELANIQHRLFNAEHSDIKNCLSIASEIHGLGIAGASGLLAVLFPKDFGTVDQFVVKSLKVIDGLRYADNIIKINPDSLKIKDGVILIETLKSKACDLNRKFNTDFWTPRKIDMILWSYGR